MRYPTKAGDVTAYMEAWNTFRAHGFWHDGFGNTFTRPPTPRDFAIPGEVDAAIKAQHQEYRQDVWSNVGAGRLALWEENTIPKYQYPTQAGLTGLGQEPTPAEWEELVEAYGGTPPATGGSDWFSSFTESLIQGATAAYIATVGPPKPLVPTTPTYPTYSVPTNWTPWILGGGAALLLVMFMRR